MEFDSIITAVSSGKADFGISGITVTEERLKNIDFSIPYTTSSQVVIVRNNDVKASGSSLLINSRVISLMMQDTSIFSQV